MAKKLAFDKTQPIVSQKQVTPFDPALADQMIEQAQAKALDEATSVTQPPIQPDMGSMTDSQLKKLLLSKINQDFSVRDMQNDLQNKQIERLMSQPVQEDLTPTMNLIASMTGNENIARGYRAPASKSEEIERSLKNLMESQRGLTQDKVSTLRNLLAERRADRSDKDQRQLLGIAAVDMRRYEDKFTKEMKSYNDAIQNTRSVITALTPDANGRINYNDVRTQLGLLASQMGNKGSQTDKDFANILQESLFSKIGNLQKFLTGEVSENTLPASFFTNIQKALQNSSIALNDKYRKNIDSLNKMGAANMNALVRDQFTNPSGQGRMLYETALSNASDPVSFSNLAPKVNSASVPSQPGEANAIPQKKILSPAEYFQQKGK